MASYRVTVPLVQVETNERTFVQLAKGAEVPSNATKAALENLIDLKYVEKVTAPAPKASNPDEAPAGGSGQTTPAGGEREPSIPDVLREVDGDVEKAKTVLAAETGEGGKNRATLVKALEAIIAGAGS